MASIINSTTTNGVTVQGDNSGSLQLATNNGTTAVTIDTSQNVGIGTTSPDGKLTIETVNSNTPRIRFQNASFDGDGAISTFVSSTGTDVVLGSNAYINSAGNFARFDSAQAGSYFYANRTGNLLFGTNDTSGVATERMRINSSGQALFGATSLLGSRNSQVGININGKDDALFIQNYGSGIGWGVTMRPSSSSSGGNGDCFNFTNTSFTTVGTIATSSSATAYNTSSDYRLKENISPMTGALATVAQLKPVTYKWKADGKDGQGFIAHELQSVVPEAVTGEKDAIDKDGNPRYQGVDASFLVATLTAAIQELKAELDATKAEVQALKGVA